VRKEQLRLWELISKHLLGETSPVQMISWPYTINLMSDTNLGKVIHSTTDYQSYYFPSKLDTSGPMTLALSA
jgi:hypothetical protein